MRNRVVAEYFGVMGELGSGVLHITDYNHDLPSKIKSSPYSYEFLLLTSEGLHTGTTVSTVSWFPDPEGAFQSAIANGFIQKEIEKVLD